jgi:hypothetical protein
MSHENGGAERAGPSRSSIQFAGAALKPGWHFGAAPLDPVRARLEIELMTALHTGLSSTFRCGGRPRRAQAAECGCETLIESSSALGLKSGLAVLPLIAVSAAAQIAAQPFRNIVATMQVPRP